MGRAALIAAAIFALTSGCSDRERPSRANVARSSFGLGWTQQTKLVASDGAAGDAFGWAVALDTGVILAAAYHDADRGTDAGSVYPFLRSGGGFTQQPKLYGSDTVAGDLFGWSVALNSSFGAVGAPGADASGQNAGKAYVFARSSASFVEIAKLAPPNGSGGFSFGSSIAVDGTTVLVGAPGANGAQSGSGKAWVFIQSGTSFVEQTTLQASDGKTGDGFGSAVALSGDTALVGASTSAAAGTNSGAAYVFVRSGTSWAEQQKLVGSAAAGDRLGYSVALDGDTAVLGAPLFSSTLPGYARIFTRTGTTWVEGPRLTASDASAGDQFGFAVALSGGELVAGAPFSDAASNAGASYLFTLAGSTWTEQARIAPVGVASDLRLARSVAISGDTLVAGTIYDDTAATDAGASYVFVLTGGACTTTADCSTGYCVDGVCCASACTAPCSACSAALKGSGADGECGPVASGTDPDGDCQPGYACVTGACTTSCTIDADCLSSHYCDASGSCRADGANGASCTGPSQCQSGFCVDNVCCASACTGPCMACSAAKQGGGTNGTCGPVAADTDPDGDCTVGSTPCGADGFCDGSGACRSFAKPSTPCGATTCDSGKISGQICDGIGGCSSSVSDCAPYVCQGAACSTSCSTDGECAATAYCTAPTINPGTCTNKQPNSDACSRVGECQSGYCSDGYCCNTPCSGQCEACDMLGGEGTCLPVTGDPHPPRQPCSPGSADAPCQRTQCDGNIVRDSCSYVGTEVECQPPSCADGVETLRATCDGQGNCTPGEPIPCAPYVCAGDHCGAGGCQSDRDCATPTFRCSPTKHDCVPATPVCDDNHTLSLVDGGIQDCGAYRCTSDGSCRQTCDSSADCVSGNRCTAERTCVPETPAPAPTNDSGCGCRAARPGAGGARVALLVATLFFGLRRRRRSCASCSA